MLGKLTGWEDTIVALATPPGIGAIGVIRVSGPDSWIMTNALFPSKDLETQDTHTLHVGLLVEDGETLDEVVLSLFRGPRSYTGEDVVEISCHGAPFVQERVVQAILRQGARLARPGEFTQRAFLHGKFDLAQAEAVADLIASNSAASAHAALHTLRGGFSKELNELKDQMMSYSALIELELDFSQEDVEFADRSHLYRLITDAQTLTASLLDSFKLGNVIKNGVQVAIIGKPNVGKSTLLNTLLNENRAIVSEIAGTTRDTIEEAINIGGILFRLVDTAGLRNAEVREPLVGREPMAGQKPMAGRETVDRGEPPGNVKAADMGEAIDKIEAFGMERSLEKMEQADIIIYLFDGADPVEEVLGRKKELEAAGKNFLLTINKIDAVGEEAARARFPEELLISAKEGRYIDRLKERLVDKVLEGRR